MKENGNVPELLEEPKVEPVVEIEKIEEPEV